MMLPASIVQVGGITLSPDSYRLVMSKIQGPGTEGHCELTILEHKRLPTYVLELCREWSASDVEVPRMYVRALGTAFLPNGYPYLSELIITKTTWLSLDDQAKLVAAAAEAQARHDDGGHPSHDHGHPHDHGHDNGSGGNGAPAT